MAKNIGIKFDAYGSRESTSTKVALKLMNTLAKWRKPIEQGMYQATVLLLDFARELCPVDTGSLRDSASVTMYLSDKWTKFHAGFGSFGYDPGPRFSREMNKTLTRQPWRYAKWVHEIMADKAFHAPPTQANFLREPAMTRRAELRQQFRAGAGL